MERRKGKRKERKTLPSLNKKYKKKKEDTVWYNC